jgi:prepilin-type N-terminal cleavage/methylation domain-containing protein
MLGCRRQDGFTLLELLVVIFVLGTMASIATLAVTRFIGSGAVEAANTELSQARTAINVCMCDAGVNHLDAAVSGWDGRGGLVLATDVSGVSHDAATYLDGPKFKARYNVDQNGVITGVTDVSWSGVSWATDRWK